MKVWLKTGRKRRPPHHCKHFAAVLVWKPGFSLVHVSHLLLLLRLYRFPHFRSYLYRGKDATYPKKRILYSLSAVLNKVLWYHWAEVLTHTHTDWRHTLSLAVPSHLLRSPASHSHSNTRPDGITPASRAEQSAPVHFPDAAGGHDDTRRANNVGLSCCRRVEILRPQSALLKRSGRDCYTENKPELITFSD